MKRVSIATNPSASGHGGLARLNAQPMHFLRTIFWVLVAVVVALFATRNWTPVTLNLWGDIQADTKLPALLLVAFLVGWLPTWLIMRARLWAMQRRLDTFERNQAATIAPSPAIEGDGEPVI